jgi:microcystin-dependent protein
MEPFMGQIQAFGFGFAPSGWALCEGQTLPIQPNAALFSLLGATYGGDGQTTFGLPDLRAASTRDNVHYCIALSGDYPSRD